MTPLILGLKHATSSFITLTPAAREHARLVGKCSPNRQLQNGNRGTGMNDFKRRLLIGAIGLAFAGTSAVALAADRHVTIINDTGYTIVRFYASSENARSWEEDMLGDSTLKPGNSVRMNIDDGSGACMFDFKAVFSDGDTMVRKGVDVCKTSSYRYR